MRLISDLRYAVRALAANMGLTAVCILTLALGIGANTAIFSVVNALLLRSLPYPQAEQLMMVYESDPGHGWPEDTPAPANFADWRARNRTFTGMAAFTDAAFNVTGFDEPERVMGFRISAGMFPVLGVRPQLGRAFSESEDRDGAERVVVLGYGYWQRRFHGDPRAIGAGLTLDDQRYSIVGVMPPGFAFPDRRAELWVPICFTARDLEQRGSHYLNVIGRLKDGVNLSAARNDMRYIGDQLAHAYPQTNTGVGVAVKPLRDAYVGDARTALIVILAAVGLVLLIACANISNLLLARAAARRREIAIRAALGAGRGRLVAQLLTESLVLALAGGLTGVLIGLWGIEAVRPLVPAMLLNAGPITVDRAVFGFTLAISLATGILFGLAPALAASKMDLHDALKEGARGSSEGLASNRLRSLLVVSEIALALMLLIAAGLMIRSFADLRSIDPGYRADHVLTMRLTMPDSRYGDAAKRSAFFDGLLAQLQALPGVKSAGVITVLPNTFKGNSSFIEFEAGRRRNLVPSRSRMCEWSARVIFKPWAFRCCAAAC